MAAKNYQGKESEQSKQRRGAGADKYAKGSAKRAAQEKRRNASTKQSRLDRIMANGNMSTTRGDNPPQHGQMDHSNIDAEGNQDTLK